MATGGWFNTSKYYGGVGGAYLVFNWSIASQSTATNQTIINWQLAGAGINDGYWYKAGNFKVTINNQQVYYSSARINLYNGTRIATGQFTINHDNNGNASFSAYAEGGIYYTAVNVTGSKSWALPKIDRFATITSANNFNDEQNPSFSYTNPTNAPMSCWLEPNPDGQHLATRNLSGTKGTFTWDLTEDERNQLRQACTNKKSCTCRIGLYSTIGGNTQASYVDKTLTITNANPTIEWIVGEDINTSTQAITEDPAYIIRNHSNLRFQLHNIKALKYATLKKFEIEINGETKNDTLSGSAVNDKFLTWGTLNLASNTDAVVKITDSRGYVTTIKETLKILDWIPPTANFTIKRKNNFYAETSILANCTYSSLNNKNSVSVWYEIERDDLGTQTLTGYLQDNVKQTFILDNNHSWNMKFRVQDRLGNTIYTYTLGRGVPIAFFDRKLSSVSINSFPKHQNSFEIDGDLFVNDENILGRLSGWNSICRSASTGDWNTACEDVTAIFMGSAMSNAPNNSSNWFFVLNMVHNDKYQRQLAFDFFSTEIWTRRKDNGTWYAWEKVH